MEQIEVLCPVDGFPGYWVSQLGHAYGPRSNGRPLRTEPTDSKHLRVTLRRDGKSFKRHLQVLVAAAFIGPKPPGMLTRHENGVHSDNVWTNLIYGTEAENHADCLAHGTHRTAFIVVCMAGRHDMTVENTGIDHGRRYCRACRRDRFAERRAFREVEQIRSGAS